MERGFFPIRNVGSPREISETKIKELDRLDLLLTGDICKKRGHFWWGAYDEREMIGFAGLEILEEKVGFLCRAGVLEPYRGNGLQKRFIKTREKKARKLQLNFLVSYTSRENFPSANNLILSGYLLYKPLKPWGLKDGLYFIKEISPKMNFYAEPTF